MYPYDNFTVPGLNSINFQGPYKKWKYRKLVEEMARIRFS